MNDFDDEDLSDVQRSFHQKEGVTHEKLVDSSLESSGLDPSGSEAYSYENYE